MFQINPKCQQLSSLQSGELFINTIKMGIKPDFLFSCTFSEVLFKLGSDKVTQDNFTHAQYSVLE